MENITTGAMEPEPIRRRDGTDNEPKREQWTSAEEFLRFLGDLTRDPDQKIPYQKNMKKEGKKDKEIEANGMAIAVEVWRVMIEGIRNPEKLPELMESIQRIKDPDIRDTAIRLLKNLPIPGWEKSEEK